jgi:hypothetical protein
MWALAEHFSGFSWCPPTPRPRRALRPRQLRRTERHTCHPDQIAGCDDILRSGARSVDAEKATIAEAARSLLPPEDLLKLAPALLTKLMRLHAPSSALSRREDAEQPSASDAARPHGYAVPR